MGLGRPKKHIPRSLDLQRLVLRSLGILRATLPQNVSLQGPDPLRDLPAIEADSTAIQQVVLNLVLNGLHATEKQKQGNIQVQLSQETPQGKDGSFLCLSVRDNGIGMSEATLSKIFNVYYSTRGEQGTGLGLSTVRDIIHQHEGIIEVQSKLEQGSEFRVFLPTTNVPLTAIYQP